MGLVLTAALCGGPVAAAAFLDGPPAATTGGFGEGSCLDCHFDFAPNPVGGRLEVLGFPHAWEPGRIYQIRIVLSGEDLAVAGFQLSFRSTRPDHRGSGAGTIHARSERIRVYEHPGNGVTYAQHTTRGTLPMASDSAWWDLRWTAPPTGAGTVVLNVAANMGDGDGSQFGDRVYLQELSAIEAAR